MSKARKSSGKKKDSSWHAWAATHCKRTYRSRLTAWLAIFRIWARERRTDSLMPYMCTWGPRWQDGRTAPPHVHIGHSSRALAPRVRRKLRYWHNRCLVWPYYRARRRWRQVRRAGSQTGNF